MNFNGFYVVIVFVLLLFPVGLVAQITNGVDVNKNDSLTHTKTNLNNFIRDLSDKKNGIDTFSVRSANKRFLGGNSLMNNSDSVVRNPNGTLIVPYVWEPFSSSVSMRDTMIFEPAYLPIVFDGRMLPRNLSFLPKDTSLAGIQQFRLIDPDTTFASTLSHIDLVGEHRRDFIKQYPERMKISTSNFSKSLVISKDVVEQKNPLRELLSTDDAINIVALDITKTKIKKSYWQKMGQHSLNVSQTMFSENWRGTGGDNSYNIQNYHAFDLNFKRDKLSVNNKLEWRMDMRSLPKHNYDQKYEIQEDYLNLRSTLELKAYKKWSYALALNVRTPLFKRDVVNSDERRGSFLAPLNVNIGPGMLYEYNWTSQVDKYKKLYYKLNVTPVSVNMTYVRDGKVDETKLGVDEGKKSNTDLGTNITLDLKYNINRYVYYENTTTYFTSYSKVIAECLNKLKFSINQYFSTSMVLNLRFDDGISKPQPKEEDGKQYKYGYFQYYEMVGFGLTYNW